MAAPTLVSAAFPTDGLRDGVSVDTVWSGSVTLGANTPTITCTARGITAAVMKYRSGTASDTIKWWVQDANNRIRVGDTVTMAFPADCVKIGADSNGAILSTATTNNSLAAAYAPTYGRTSPFKIYSDIRGNGANTLYVAPVESIVEFGPSEVDTLAHFQTAAATKLPVASCLALLNFENMYPGSGNYADFDTDAAWPPNLVILNSILDWAIATYPTHKFAPYPGPNIWSAIAGSGGASARADRLLYASRSYSLVDLIGHANCMCPEFFDRDPTMDQAAMNDYATYAMSLARAINSLAYPRAMRTIYPVIYLNLPDSPYTDFTAERIAVSVSALQAAGADGVIYAGSESLKTAAQWQADANVRQRYAMIAGKVLGLPSYPVIRTNRRIGYRTLSKRRAA